VKSLRKWLVAGAVLAAFVVIGAAYAASRDNGNNPGNAPVAGAQAPPSIVGSTTGGMPPTAQVFYAVVNSDGTLARSFPTSHVTADRITTGQYEVIFKNDVTGCAYTASVGLSTTSGASSPGYATVVGRAGQPHGIFLETFNASGALADLGFHVQVTC
jgi:hypothetical protein